jgi:hypothetical protein
MSVTAKSQTLFILVTYKAFPGFCKVNYWKELTKPQLNPKILKSHESLIHQHKSVPSSRRLPPPTTHSLTMSTPDNPTSAKPQTLYFGYGSNLWLHQMQLRCPTSQYLGVARLPNYRWIINDRGYANVVERRDTAEAEAEAEAGAADQVDRPSSSRSRQQQRNSSSRRRLRPGLQPPASGRGAAGRQRGRPRGVHQGDAGGRLLGVGSARRGRVGGCLGAGAGQGRAGLH